MIFGAGLAGWLPTGFGGGLLGRLGRGAARSKGQSSEVRSPMLAMELDHDTNTLRGKVLAGRFAGRSLDELQQRELMTLFAELATDRDGRLLLEAYLDRRAPGWREDFQEDAAARPGEGARGRPAMTKEEAYQILGVEPGAARDDIRRAHRTLMKKLHPDQGGSTYLAARVNEARDLLLGSHR
jgi:DnaJ-domain-containing protein 1